jgi:hypothetical protein
VSWILTFYSLIGVWMVGRKWKSGWLVSLSCQVLWFIYAVTTNQYGFIFSALVFSWIYIVNYRKWKNEGIHASGERGATTRRISP